QQWDGKYTDRLLVLRDNEGMGDCIQFLRYVPLVQKICPRILLGVKAELMNLVKQSFPDVPASICVLEHNSTTINLAEEDIPTLRQCAFTGLGNIFQTIPTNPYLKAGKRINGGIGFCLYSDEMRDVDIYDFKISFLAKSIPHMLFEHLIDKYNMR